jgi:anti-sigma regulatory factor (Ser/Thr protein kinase)
MATSEVFRATARPHCQRPPRTLIVPARAEQVPVARSFVAEVLGLRHPCASAVVLLTSELVTNSIRHSGSGPLGETIAVTAIVRAGTVRIEVTDSSGPTVPSVRDASVDASVDASELAEGGRGLRLVQALAASWGYQCGDGHTTTWFVCAPLAHAVGGCAGNSPRPRRLPPLNPEAGDAG